MIIFRVLSCLFLTALLSTAVPVVTNLGNVTVNSFDMGDATNPWTLNVTVSGIASSFLVFSDTDADVLGPSGRRSVSITVTNLTGEQLRSFEFHLVSGPTFDTSSFSGFLDPLYSCCIGQHVPWVNSFFPFVGNGGAIVRGFTIESGVPVSSFRMELTPNSDVIPEPSTLSLAGIALCAAVLFHRYGQRLIVRGAGR